MQILSNLANDYGDGIKGTDNQNRIGPERAIQSGKISPPAMLKAIRINIFVSIVLALSLILVAFGFENIWLSVFFIALGMASVIAAMKYTIGDNAYGYKGLGDVFVFIFFGLVSVIGGYVLYTKTIDFVVFLPAFTVGLLSMGVLNLNNMRDIISDEKSNKNTLAVKLGQKKVKIYHTLLIVSAIILSVLFGVIYYKSPLNLIFIVAYFPLLQHVKAVHTNKNPKLLDPELKKLALTTVFLAILMGVGHLF